METQHWLKACPLQTETTCKVVYTWPKPAALLGRQAYEGAWQDTTANIFGTRFFFDTPHTPQAVKIEFLANRGTFHIWGMAFEQN